MWEINRLPTLLSSSSVTLLQNINHWVYKAGLQSCPNQMEPPNSTLVRSYLYPPTPAPSPSSQQQQPLPRLDNNVGFFPLTSSNSKQYTSYLNHTINKNLAHSFSHVSVHTLKEGSAVDLNCDIHMIVTLSVRPVKAQLWKGALPTLLLKHQLTHAFYLSCYRLSYPRGSAFPVARPFSL